MVAGRPAPGQAALSERLGIDCGNPRPPQPVGVTETTRLTCLDILTSPFVNQGIGGAS